MYGIGGRSGSMALPPCRTDRRADASSRLTVAPEAEVGVDGVASHPRRTVRHAGDGPAGPEDPVDDHGVMAADDGTRDPADEALLAESVGAALMVVLDRLGPAERVAFVLHDVFAVPFDEIAEILGRTPDASRQLASRARRRLQGSP